MSLTLTSKETSNYTPPPEGIHSAVCVDLIDLGLMPVEFNGQASMKPKLQLVWELDEKGPDGKHYNVRKSYTASLHPKAGLSKAIGQWRGKPVAVGETIELSKLLGACCTLVLSHQPKRDGTGNYVSIDAISKATKKLAPSGEYDPAAARERMNEWRAKNNLTPLPGTVSEAAPADAPAQAEEPDDVGF